MAKIKTMQNEDINLELDPNGIATGDTKEDKKQRKRFIMDFYKMWETENPQKQVFNKSLKDFVNVSQKSTILHHRNRKRLMKFERYPHKIISRQILWCKDTTFFLLAIKMTIIFQK